MLRLKKTAAVFSYSIYAKMPIGKVGGNASPLRPDDESFLDEERLIDFLKGSLVLTDGSGDRARTDRTSLEGIDYGPQDFVVDGIETHLVNLELVQSISGYLKVNVSVSHDLCKISNPF